MSKVNISAGRETIESYVGGANNRNKLTFIIPEFQRPYEWSKREVETFLDDIFDFAESDRDEYFLGTVITYLPGDDSIEIVDGQQRITTLFLFLRAVYEYFENLDTAKADNETKRTRDTLLTLLTESIWRTRGYTGLPEKNDPRIVTKVVYEEGDTSLRDIMREGSSLEQTKKNASPYERNFDIISRFIKGYFKAVDPLESMESIFKIIKEVWIMTVSSDDLDTAMRAFENVNARGRSLSPSDIYKGRIYAELAAGGERDKFIRFWEDQNARWSKLGSRNLKGVSTIFETYAYVLFAINKRTATNEQPLKLYFGPRNSDNLLNGYTKGYYDSILSFFELAYNADTTNITNAEQWITKEIECYLDTLIQHPDPAFVTCACIYYLFNKNENPEEFANEFLKFLEKLTHLGLTAVLKQESKGGLQATFNHIAVYSHDKDHEIINSKTTPPSQSVAREVFNTKPATGYSHRWRRSYQFILRLYSYMLGGFEERLPKTLEFEHIFPKSKSIEGLTKEKSDYYIDFVGNITLLTKEDNASVSNREYREKRGIYEASGIPIAENVAETYEEKFQESEIIKRGEEILETCMFFLDNAKSFHGNGEGIAVVEEEEEAEEEGLFDLDAYLATKSKKDLYRLSEISKHLR